MFRRRGERGGSTSIGAVLVLPALLAAILAVIQAGVWLHGRNTTLTAAEVAAETARLAGSDDSQVAASAQAIGRQAGMIITTSTRRSGTTVTVTVTGTQSQFIPVPGLGTHTQTVALPVERTTNP